MEQVEQQVPEMMELATNLRQKKESIQIKGIDVGDRLKALRRSIQKTRELANKIKVGVDFQPNTTIELQNPEDITKAATSTKVWRLSFRLWWCVDFIYFGVEVLELTCLPIFLSYNLLKFLLSICQFVYQLIQLFMYLLFV